LIIPLGILQKHAKAAAAMVNVTYKDIRRPVSTIRDAIEADSLFSDSYRKLDSGADVRSLLFFVSQNVMYT
jgi:hypothetical protein